MRVSETVISNLVGAQGVVMVYIFREAGRKELLTLVTDILHFFRYISPARCRANVAHIRQPRPDSGLGFQAKIP